MPEKRADEYANIYQITLTESATNTLTYTEINMGLTLFQKKAILVSRIVIDWGMVAIAALSDVSDTLIIGLCQNNQPTSIALSDSSTIWKTQKAGMKYGTPANYVIEDVVSVFDLSDIPGGGEFIVPSPLYGAIQGASLGGAQTVTMRLYFNVVDLKPDEYIELLEARHFYG